MNIFLDNLVTLNQIILQNAREQFPDVGEKKLLYRAMKAMRADELTAKISTEIVSGETRYEIATSTDGTSWKMTLNFSFSRQVPQTPYVVLSFNTFGNAEELIFNSVIETGAENRYLAELELRELAQRDALLRALSDFDAQTTLVITLVTDHGLTNTITDPKVFYFAENYYPYIYQGILPPPARLQLTLLPLIYRNEACNYYQDYLLKNYLYYLPDTFEVGLDPALKPMLSFSFSAPENATRLQQVTVTLAYFLLPRVNQARIADARDQFAHLQQDARLVPFANADTLALQLELPGGISQEKNALINLQSGIADSFTLPISQFATIWDALFSTSPQRLLLKGELVVQPKGFNPDRLPRRIALDEKYKDKPLDFISQSSPADISNTLTFKSDPQAYSPSGPRPIERMLVNIDNETFELNKNNMNHDVIVKVPVINLILHPDKKIVYNYDLQIRYLDGGKTELTNQTTTFEIIYVP